MNNLEMYEAMREVPEEAKKRITGGRLNGMTDINPMWRIKKLTEVFGMCGVGWYYVIDQYWTEEVEDKVTANVMIQLYVKVNGEWSMPVVGVGGSMLLDQQKSGAYVNDECYKMATTDAISVACKALGMGADVYWQNDSTKYNDLKKEMAEGETTPISESHVNIIRSKAEKVGMTPADVAEKFNKSSVYDMTEAEYGRAMNQLAGMKGVDG